MKEILRDDHPVNKDVFVQVPKSQFASGVLDKFQTIALFFL